MKKREYDPNKRGISAERDIPPDRVAWVHADWLDVIQYRYPDMGRRPETREEARDEEEMEKYGVAHVLDFRDKSARRHLWINLSKFTVAELDAIKEVVDRVFDEARGECLSRDAKAQEAYDNGYDAVQRLYRPVPKVIYRPGEERPHS